MSDRARQAVGLLIVGAVVVAGGVLAVRGIGHLTRPAVFCPEASVSDQVAGSSDLDERTADYTGHGPHSLERYEVSTSSRTGDLVMEPTKPSAGELPATWDAKYEGGEAVDVQLVLCVYPGQNADVATIGTCDGYTAGRGDSSRAEKISVPAKAATVTYRLYEATTKHLLTKFDLAATAGDGWDCPEAVTYLASMDPTVWIFPKPAAVAARLRPLVEASR
ncbi:hypothetical protein [Kribbella sp. DT2]|uniref:hypothetical protein n=1 Tax=Kribbella sp. DT2 TaxID=3393427 RepID=UPI003CF5A89D